MTAGRLRVSRILEARNAIKYSFSNGIVFVIVPFSLFYIYNRRDKLILGQVYYIIKGIADFMNHVKYSKRLFVR